MKARDRIVTRIAQEAARLMNEEGIEEHHWAKLKALDRLSLQRNRPVLPSDAEVEAARVDHWRLFGPDREVPMHIGDLRSLALDIMDRLARFSPRLVGSVAAGTAGPHSPIVIHVFPDVPEDVITTLIDLGISYREGHHLARQGHEPAARLPALSLNQRGTTIEVLLFPSALQGRAAGTRRDGLAQVTLSELRGLLAAQRPNTTPSSSGP